MTTSASPTTEGRTEQAAPPRVSSDRRRFRLRRPSPWHLVLIPISFILLFPFYLMVVTSLQTEAQTRRFPPLLTPPTPQWSNYATALNAAPFVQFMVNSAVVALIIVAGNLVLCSIAGYAFARLRFAGRGLVFGLLMATLMVPFQVTMIPEFLIVKWLGTNVWDQLGVDHLGALVLPTLATAFGIFFLRQFFLTVPIELEEAARMDGTSRLGVLFKIVLPLSLPALSTVAAITFLDAWNSFLWPLIVINTESHMTLPLGLTTFQGSHDTHWELLMAGNVFSLVPMLLVFFVAQRYFVRSVAATGLKG
ncbi:MAG TPA: carbohydrate ABC transporter permease [Nocardioidaceae bacterium]|jgi:multiple sugar transport system permease protein|nr:carbohydrate ABC transporter permease [Nocardioidaceae bacterium]